MNTKEKDVKLGAIQTMIELIDWTPINEKISERVGYAVECRAGHGLIRDVTAQWDKDQEPESRSIILDKECCGVTAKNENFLISDLCEKPFTVKKFEGIGFFQKFNDKGEKVMAMFPKFYFSIDQDDVYKCLTGESIPLYQHMGQRYGYNPRIHSNELQILQKLYQGANYKDWVKTEKKLIAI